MNKLLIKLTACAFGLVLSGAVIAADQTSPDKDAPPSAAKSDTNAAPDAAAGDVNAEKSTQTDPLPTPKGKPASVAADKSSKPEEVSEAYTAALKKCGSLTGTEKDTCEQSAKQEHGKM